MLEEGEDWEMSEDGGCVGLFVVDTGNVLERHVNFRLVFKPCDLS